jgi:Cd2+/Zn2+-exporting ATPase
MNAHTDQVGKKMHEHSDGKSAHAHDHDHGHGDEESSIVKNESLRALISFVLLAGGLIMDFWIRPEVFTGASRFVWYSVAYLPVGIPVLIRGIKLAVQGDFFTEFILMSIATIGAFYVGQYPEGVAVMLFYAVGELFQDAAVDRARKSIKALLDVRPDHATVFRDGNFIAVDPADVKVNETIRVKPGERVPLDGEMLSEECSFNTAALTGESKPITIGKSQTVLAGMINEAKLVDLRVTRLFNDSSLARILTLVQHATGRKARTELLIRRFAHVYTPIVVFLAVALTLMPYFFVADYNFEQWFYRALIFLVISCPCALVVAIPLGYFGGIGAGSRNGILFKGSNYLDLITRVDTVVFDKTGTLTKGVFKVQKIVSLGVAESIWLPLVTALEQQSSHPIGRAIVEHVGRSGSKITSQEEIRGEGLIGFIEGKEILVGNNALLQRYKVPVESEVLILSETVVMVAIDKKLAGYITIADEIKEDSKLAISLLQENGIRTVLLSGDKQQVVDTVAKELNIEEAYGGLLPEEKVEKVEAIKKGKKQPIAFVGDGINDAPVLALSDVGIAMGGMGSDAAIETADIVIQTDQPSRIITAIQIGKRTNKIVWQNIFLAFGVKIIVLGLGAWGAASMWEAVFADVGVALLAILNAARIQRVKF